MELSIIILMIWNVVLTFLALRNFAILKAMKDWMLVANKYLTGKY